MSYGIVLVDRDDNIPSLHHLPSSYGDALILDQFKKIYESYFSKSCDKELEGIGKQMVVFIYSARIAN